MRCLLACLLLVSVGYAQPPKLEILPKDEITTNLCDYAEVTVKTTAKGVLWQVPEGIKRFDQAKLVDPNTAYFKFPKVGTYWLNVIAAEAVGNKIEFTEKRVKVVVVDVEKKEEKKEVLPVEPKKVEPPVEPVAAKKLAVIIVEESAQAAENRAKFFNDKSLADKIAQRNHKVIAIDKDVRDKSGNVPPTLVGYLNEAKGKQLPWIVIVDPSTSKVLHSGAMSNDPAVVLKLLTQFGG